MKRIAISLGGIGGFQDGLGEFALQIGSRVQAVAREWRDVHGIGFDFHLREHLVGAFGDDVGYWTVRRWQRLRHVRPAPYDIWHSLHQLNKTLPPAGSRERIVTVHDLNYLVNKNAFSRWRDERRTRRLLARTDRIVAISEYTAADVRRHLGWTGPLDVILRGARRYTGGPQQPLPGWTPDGDPPFLFHLSRMSPSKNVQAIAGLARAWPAMRFVFCGPPGDDSRAFRDRTLAAALPNVEFHLGISDAQKAWAFAHCAGFVFPSLAEGFGLPPIEAMQFGTPCFLSRLTSLPEIGRDVADYFDDNDGFEPQAMRAVVERGLARVAADPRRRDAIRAHAARFDADRKADEYLALWRCRLDAAAVTA